MIHKICDYCGKIGHKRDMIDYRFYPDECSEYTVYYHEECYAKKFGLKRCACGKGWVKNDKQGKR